MTKVRTEQQSALLVATLSESDKRNAFTRDMRLEFEAVVDRFIGDPGLRALMVTGEGDFFCAGGDVRSFLSPSSPGANRSRLADSHRLLLKLARVEKPVVMAVNGPAAGAGFGLALAGDIAIASDTAFFQPAFSAIGLAPDFALGRSLARCVGDKRAADILMTNRKVLAVDALAMGLVSRVYPAAAFHEQAVKLAASLAQGPTVAHGLAKTLLRAGGQSGLDDFLALEASSQAIAMATDDHRAGVEGFLNKARPVFAGA